MAESVKNIMTLKDFPLINKVLKFDLWEQMLAQHQKKNIL